jgi:hypothetical protein
MALCINCGLEPIENHDTGLGAICGAAARKAEREEAKAALKGKPKPIAKVSPRQAAINQKYSGSLRERYQDAPKQICAGCGEPATCTAHIIAKSRLKLIGKPELIWSVKASFPSCHACNLAIENPKGQDWKSLANIEECLAFIEQHDPELHRKFMVNL